MSPGAEQERRSHRLRWRAVAQTPAPAFRGNAYVHSQLPSCDFQARWKSVERDL